MLLKEVLCINNQCNEETEVLQRGVHPQGTWNEGSQGGDAGVKRAGTFGWCLKDSKADWFP